MKTTLEEKIKATSGKAHTLGQKAIKHPVSSILSLCVLGICAATIAGFSQAPTEKNVLPATPAPAATGAAIPNTLPLARTLTSADGRTIDVTILSKSATAIKAKKADGKEVEIKLDKLSEADRAFVAGLVEAPIKKIKVLSVGKDGLNPRMEKAGFEITILNRTEDLQTISDQELESFDAILTAGPPKPHTIQVDRLIKWTHDEKIIAWRHFYKTDKREFINKKLEPALFKGRGEMRDQETFIDIQGNTIFYSPTKCNFKTDDEELLDENILDQVFVELKRRIQLKNSIQKKVE